MDNNAIEVKVTSIETVARTDLDAVIYDLDKQIELLSSQADKWDHLVAVASGILCGMLDILWVGECCQVPGGKIPHTQRRKHARLRWRFTASSP